MNIQEFYQGNSFDAYEYLGAHPDGGAYVFRTYAPAARKVSLIGEFNNWQDQPMHQVEDGKFWECTSDCARQGQMYKYRITDCNGKTLDRADPYGFWAELRPNSASRIRDLADYTFSDQDWQKKKTGDPYASLSEPLNIYEMHPGAWKKPGHAQTDWYSYDQLIPLLVPYLKENHYNYVEFMPLTEYPSDESWGYQATGFFAPTARYGRPDQLCALVDALHKADIGVILDFVPVHFAVNDYALFQYDGTHLYEYPSTDIGYSEWGSCNFMHSSGEVRSFLSSSAYYWLKEFHFDGLRMDAVRNLLYWMGDEARGEYKPGIDFLKGMNKGLKDRLPDALLIAEDSSNYTKVTAPVEYGGLGFDYKWDLGWMNDTLDYFKRSPEEKRNMPYRLTFSMDYFKNEHYILPLSHDEVVHGKATILQKMYGDDKMPAARALYLYMMAHPGKKLNFMGNELAGLREFDEKRELDWDLLDREPNRIFYNYIQSLNELYRTHPAFYEKDYWPDKFEWVTHSYENSGIFLFTRGADSEKLLFAFNFSDRSGVIRLAVRGKKLHMIFESSGGKGTRLEEEKQESYTLILTAMSGSVYQVIPKKQAE